MSVSGMMCVLWLSLCGVTIHAQPDNKYIEAQNPTADLHLLYPRAINFSFSPETLIQIGEGDIQMVLVNISCVSCTWGDVYGLVPDIVDSDIGTIQNYTLPDLTLGNGWRTSGSIAIRGVFLGKTSMSVQVLDRSGSNEDFTMTEVYRIDALRQMVVLDFVFIVIIAALVGTNTIAYACTLDLDVVKAHIKRPIGITIGFCCQYLFMPVVAFLLAWLFRLEDSLAFGLLCYGASPGGGASNVWTILLRGDLNLSVSMTFISITSSLAMTSLWLFTLGRMFTGNIKVPYHNIFISLASLLATVIIGLLIKRFAPRAAKILTKIIKPLAGVIIIYILTFGTYTNLYIFRLMNSWQVVLSATLVSYIGYLLSFISALLLRRTWKETRTIVIETGIQNGALAILIVKYSLPQPDGDLATVAPATALMTNGVPLIIAFIIQCIYRKYKGKPVFRSSKKDSNADSDSVGSSKDLPPKEGAVNKAFTPSSSFQSDLCSISSGVHGGSNTTSLVGAGMLHFLALPSRPRHSGRAYTSSSGYDSPTILPSRSSSYTDSQDKIKGLTFESVV